MKASCVLCGEPTKLDEEKVTRDENEEPLPVRHEECHRVFIETQRTVQRLRESVVGRPVGEQDDDADRH